MAQGTAVNPFLAELYLGTSEKHRIAPEHIGLVYASMRARLSLGDSASLAIDAEEKNDSLEKFSAVAEISVRRAGDDRSRFLNFQLEKAGTIQLGRHVEDVEISAPDLRVEIGGAKEALLIAPVSIQCQMLTVNAERIIVEAPPGIRSAAISLEADVAETSMMTSIPTVNGEVTLSVMWPGAENYPWTSFCSTPTVVPDPSLKEGLRRFRKFIIAFRSHSKGALKRLADKLEHKRMTKGSGQAILDRMLAVGILSTDGTMYTLHPDVLKTETGASYVSTMAQVYSNQTIKFVEDALEINR